MLALAVVFPWRSKSGRKSAALFGAVTLVVFGIAIAGYVHGIITFRAEVTRSAGGNSEEPMFRDDYLHFDTDIDPAYVLMWKGDTPGATNPREWPPPGELGGIGVYTILVLAGMGVAIALARKRTVVIVTCLVLAGVWFQRFWVAHYLWSTKLVQLYPRTAIELAYLLFVIAGFGVYYLVEFARRRVDADDKHGSSRLIGAFCALALLFGMMASGVADRYMPYDSLPRTLGIFTFAAHQAKKENQSPYPERSVVQPQP